MYIHTVLPQAALHKTTQRVPVPKAASDAETVPAPPVDGDGPPSAADLVTEMLGKIEGTNRGIDCTSSERDSIDGIIERVGGDACRVLLKSLQPSLYRQLHRRVPHRWLTVCKG